MCSPVSNLHLLTGFFYWLISAYKQSAYKLVSVNSLVTFAPLWDCYLCFTPFTLFPRHRVFMCRYFSGHYWGTPVCCCLFPSVQLYIIIRISTNLSRNICNIWHHYFSYDKCYILRRMSYLFRHPKPIGIPAIVIVICQ